MRGRALRKGIITALVIVLALFTIVMVIPNVRLAHQIFRAQPQNVYLPYVRFDELPYQPVETRGVIDGPGERFFKEGMNCYVRKDFNGAVRNLELAIRHAPDKAHWWLYLGISHYVRHEYEPAVNALKNAKFMSSTIAELRPHANWYLAQAYLMVNRPADAIPLLQLVSTEKREHAADADTLLAQVNRIAIIVPAK